MMNWISANANAIQAFSAVVQAIFAIVLAIVGAGQWWVYRDQARTMRESREIAYAALDRPYILIESATHNRDKWQEGTATHLAFRFRFQNYGNGPAIVRKIVADVFLSSGADDANAKISFPATRFPRPGDIGMLYRRPVIADPDRDVTPVGHEAKSFVLVPKAPGPLLGQYAVLTPPPSPPTRLQDRQYPDDPYLRPRADRRSRADPDRREWDLGYTGVRHAAGDVPVWLVGLVIYEDILGREHHTIFCFRGERDGSAVEMYDPPYNERT